MRFKPNQKIICVDPWYQDVLILNENREYTVLGYTEKQGVLLKELPDVKQGFFENRFVDPFTHSVLQMIIDFAKNYEFLNNDPTQSS